MDVKNKNIAKRDTAAKKSSTVVTQDVGNYEKHPFFIKKATTAKGLLSKVGLPE